VRCRFCDSELPERALFCGECGRAVAVSAASSSAQLAHPIVARPLTVAAPPPEPGLTVATGAVGVIVDACEQCGSSLAPTDIFCGECGFVTRAPARSEGDFSPAPPAPAPAPAPTAVSAADEAVDEDSTVETPASERFVLQFSTGESATVTGSGLIGRSPRPEPGEFFDALVTVNDPSRSVSKTHLEFGQHDGVLWISDRFSGNGTVVRRPDDGALRYEPGRRYLVPRGSRVELADQYFVVG